MLGVQAVTNTLTKSFGKATKHSTVNVDPATCVNIAIAHKYNFGMQRSCVGNKVTTRLCHEAWCVTAEHVVQTFANCFAVYRNMWSVVEITPGVATTKVHKLWCNGFFSNFSNELLAQLQWCKPRIEVALLRTHVKRNASCTTSIACSNKNLFCICEATTEFFRQWPVGTFAVVKQAHTHFCLGCFSKHFV